MTARLDPARLDPARLDELTGDRDRVVDLVRIVSLLVVVAGHSIMLTVATAGDTIVLGNLLADVPAPQVATWLLQVLPLFFFAGAAASTLSWMSRPDHPGDHPSAGQWLLARAQRLLRPVFWYLIAVSVVIILLHLLDADAVADVIARLGVQLLWFLGAYLLILATVPLLQRLRTTSGVLIVIGMAWVATAAVDVVRIGVGCEAFGYLGFLTVWIIPAVFGVAYAKRLISPVQAAVIALVGLSIDIALVVVGPYEVSLVTVPGQQISNMSPPSLLLAGHAVVLCCLAIAARGILAGVAARPRVWWWTVLGNRGAMTLYLWHLPALAVIVWIGMMLGHPRADPSAGGFGPIVGIQTVLLIAVMIPVVATLSPLENRPLRWWDSRRERTTSRGRDSMVLTGLVVTAVSLLMLARYGMQGPGLVWLAIAVAAASAARVVSAPMARSGA